MPRLNKKSQKKITRNKARNATRSAEDDKKKLFVEVISNEEFPKTNALRPPALNQKSQSNVKDSKNIKFPNKSKRSPSVRINVRRPSTGSEHSRFSEKAFERESVASSLGNFEKYQHHLMLLRLDSKPMTRRILDSEQLKEIDLGEDIWQDEEEAGPDIGTDTESDTDSDVAAKDKIDKLQKSFVRSEQYLQGKGGGPKLDFFDIIGEIPDIENISPDITEPSEEEDIVRLSSTEVARDVGKFVDPLTGAEMAPSSSSEDVHAEPEVSMHSIEQEESDTDLLEELQFDEDEDLGEADEDKDGGHDDGDVDVSFGGWLNAPVEHVIIADEFPQAVHDEYMRKVNIHVLDFLNKLISYIVNAVEIGDSSRIINRALDKKKLMDELNDKLKQLEIARSENLFLNKAVVKVIRGRGDYRPLQADNPEQIQRLIAKDQELKNKLYDSLYREEELKNVSDLKISNLTAEIEAAEINAKQSLNNLEKNIKKAFCRDHFQYMNEVVSRSLKQMSITCEAIANQRFLLMQRLHTLGELQEREHALENIGSGLKLRNFEILQAEVTNLDTKIYEREHDLNYLQVKRNKDLHIMTHLMERHSMIESSTAIKESFLDGLVEEKKRAREELNYNKMIRNSIRHEIYILQDQSGLAGNEALLLDYDKTKNDLEELRTRVNKLRQKHKQLEGHFSRLEKRHNRFSSI